MDNLFISPSPQVKALLIKPMVVLGMSISCRGYCLEFFARNIKVWKAYIPRTVPDAMRETVLSEEGKTTLC